MQRLSDMSTSELVTMASNEVSSITEIGIHSELVKELTTRLSANTVAVTQALKERDEARTELSSAMLTISQITQVLGTSDTLSISEQVAELKVQVWQEAKDFTKSMLASDSVDHIVFLFDGKVAQLRKESGK
jgi:RNA-binding protein YhbY